MHNDPLIKHEHTEIPVIDEYKFFGVIFDRKVTLIPHIKYLKKQINLSPTTSVSGRPHRIES